MILNRKYLHGLLICALMTSLSGQTYLSGDISKFKLDSINNPFIVEKDIEVPRGKKVIISEGCVFLFKNYTGLSIFGSLSVMGSQDHPVKFTSINDGSIPNGPRTDSKPDAFDWNGISIDQQAEVINFNFFQIAYSVYGIKSSKRDISVLHGIFTSNGQFNFTISEKIMEVQEGIPFSYPVGIDQNIKNSIDGKTSLYITSSPSIAEVYLNKKPSKRTSPDTRTPAIIKNLKNTSVNLTLFKKNYTDTTLSFEVFPGKVNRIDISLEKIKPELVNVQNKFLSDRAHVRAGKILVFSSPLFIAGGAGLMYLSEKNRRKADEARSYLEKTILQTGSKYEAMQRQYDEESYERSTKFYPGIALLSLAVIDLGIGLVLYF